MNRAEFANSIVLAETAHGEPLHLICTICPLVFEILNLMAWMRNLGNFAEINFVICFFGASGSMHLFFSAISLMYRRQGIRGVFCCQSTVKVMNLHAFCEIYMVA